MNLVRSGVRLKKLTLGQIFLLANEESVTTITMYELQDIQCKIK